MTALVENNDGILAIVAAVHMELDFLMIIQREKTANELVELLVSRTLVGIHGTLPKSSIRYEKI